MCAAATYLLEESSEFVKLSRARHVHSCLQSTAGLAHLGWCNVMFRPMFSNINQLGHVSIVHN